MHIGSFAPVIQVSILNFMIQILYISSMSKITWLLDDKEDILTFFFNLLMPYYDASR